MSLLFWRKATSENKTSRPPYTFENERAVETSVANPFPVQIIHPDDNDVPPVQTTVGSVIDPVVATPTIYNLTLTSADTQYSQALPANCRRFEFQCRTENVCRYAFEASKVATPTAPYFTLKAGDYYQSGPINQVSSSSTIYLASATAGVVVEILAWV